MIGVDTNVLARLVVNDDERQHQAAIRFFSERSPADPAFVSTVVQVEVTWLLSQTLGFPMERVIAFLEAMLASADLVVEQRDLLEEALYQVKDTRLDLADFLIAGLSAKAGCKATVTFDKPAAKRVPGMELLS